MLNVVIVDDEPAARRALLECCALESDLQVVGEFGDFRTALDAIKKQPPDVLFLDIQLDDDTGLDLARQLDPAASTAIVFVTAYDHYALEAFDVSAIDYLLKPFDRDRFKKALARVRFRHELVGSGERRQMLSFATEEFARGARAPTDYRPRLLAEADGRMHILDVRQIEVVESDRNYVRFRVGRETYHARSTLTHVEAAVRSEQVLRISRTCLVNMAHVKEVSRTPRGEIILVLAGGTTVTTSEKWRDSVRQYLDLLKLPH